jgi:hypothetical protein
MKRVASEKSVSEITRKSYCSDKEEINSEFSSAAIDGDCTGRREEEREPVLGVEEVGLLINRDFTLFSIYSPTSATISQFISFLQNNSHPITEDLHLNGALNKLDNAFISCNMDHQDIKEKVAILDFGAQYGKVSKYLLKTFILFVFSGDRSSCSRIKRLFGDFTVVYIG